MNLLKFRRKNFASLKKRKSTKRKSTKRKSTKRKSIKKFSIRKNTLYGGGEVLPIQDSSDDKQNAAQILDILTPKNSGDGNDISRGDKIHIMSEEEIMNGLRENIEALNKNKKWEKRETHAQTGDPIIYKFKVKEEYLHYNISVDGDITYICSCSVKVFNDLLRKEGLPLLQN